MNKSNDNTSKPKLTLNLSDFNLSDLPELIKLLVAISKHGLPSNMSFKGAEILLDRESGDLFLTNEDGQIAKLYGESLKGWTYCPICGNEGFEDDLPLECLNRTPFVM